MLVLNLLEKENQPYNYYIVISSVENKNLLSSGNILKIVQELDQFEKEKF